MKTLLRIITYILILAGISAVWEFVDVATYGFTQRSAADAIAAAIIAMQLEERVYGERKDNVQLRKGKTMIMETVIEYAEKRLKTCEDYDKAYWAAYLDGARSQKREYEKCGAGENGVTPDIYDKCGTGENGVIPDTDVYVRRTTMTDREKLIELLKENCHFGQKCPGECTGCMADHLIANGVTVQKWIPVVEGLPKPGCIEEYLVETNDGVRYLAIYDGDCKWKEWSDEYKVYMEMSRYKKVVRWMPLPPKEDEA